MADETAQGIANVGALTDMQRKSASYNALAKAYGPAIAFDPTNAFNASKADVQQQTAPTEVQQAGATLAGTQADTGLKQAEATKSSAAATGMQFSNETLAALRGIGMAKAVANPDGSIPADDARHILSNPAYGIDPAHIDPLVARMSQPQQKDPATGKVTSPGGVDLLDNMREALMSGGKASGAISYMTMPDGTTVAVRGNSLGGVSETNLGAAQTAGQQNAATNRAGLPIKQQNANAHSLSASASMLTAQNPTQTITGADGQVYTLTRQPRVAGVQPQATGLQSIQGPAGTQAKAGATVVGKAQGVNAADALPQNVAIARADLGQMDLQYGRTFDALGKASALVTPFSTGVGAATIGRLPASQTKALEAQIQTAKSNIALITANMSRQGGKSSAIPVRNMQEFKAYQDALGAIDVHAAPSVVRDQIATAHTSLQNLQSGVHTMYQAKYGTGLGVQPPAAAAAPAGWSIKQVP